MRSSQPDAGAEGTSLDQSVEPLGGLELGEAIIAGLAIAGDLGPININVGEPLPVEPDGHLGRSLVAGDYLEPVAVKDGAVAGPVAEGEGSGLADDQRAGTGRERVIEPGQAGGPGADCLIPDSGEVAGPRGRAAEFGRAEEEVRPDPDHQD